jgi:hypothetical protein
MLWDTIGPMKNRQSMSAGQKAAKTRGRNAAARQRDYERRFKKAEENERWAVTMAKVRIRRAVAEAPWPHWHLLTFAGPNRGESTGVVDMIAIRKDHGKPYPGTKRGDGFQIILIQVKGGSAARPTADDGARLRKVALRHGACGILLATWKKGTAAQFFSLRATAGNAKGDWEDIADLAKLFGKSGS